MSADGRSFEFDFQELVADWFAGGGGASEGIKEALGRDPDFAINHDGDALAMHTVNHPDTTHIESDVWVVDPAKVMGYRQIGLGWFSPDCKHFSKAKGGKPVSKKIRGLAWVIPRVAAKVKPRVIIMENVEEFKTWGPLKQIDGQWYPDPSRKGETFNRFIARLKKLGYEVEHRELRACDYGTPTIRKRLFLIARRDGLPIVWPEPTHGNPKSLLVQSGKLLPWRTAAECIDWSIPCPSIFERKKPLAEATLRRIARGVMRYVVDSANPFIVPIANYGSGLRVNSIDDPLTTVTANPKGGQHAVVVPHITKFRNGATGVGMDEPLPTVTANSFIKRPGGSVPIGYVAATLIQAAHGEGKPGGVQRWGDGTADIQQPVKTVTASGTHAGEVRAFLIKYYGTEQDPRLEEPMHTIPTKDRFGLVMVRGELYRIVDIGMRMLTPRELATAQGFPLSYIIDRRPDGTPLTKTAQVRMIGNSVCPPLAAALIRANFSHEKRQTAARPKRQPATRRLRVAA